MCIQRLALAVLAGLFFLPLTQLWARPLANRFEEPAQSDGVYAFWHWMGRHVSREGITRDLEELAAAGFAGVELFQLADVSTAGSGSIGNNPLNAPELLSPGWWSLVGHAVAECDRLGMQLWLHNTLGWSAGGGPWVTEALARKKIVFTETIVQAGTALLQPPRRAVPTNGSQHSRDIAMVAVPAAGAVPFEQIVVLGDRPGPDGNLSWTAPAGAGDWVVYRFAEVLEGTRISPGNPEATGWIFDHLQADATRHHLRFMLDPLLRVAGGLAGRGLGGLAIDSLDVHLPLWTTNLPQIVRERLGYDLMPWLITYANREIADKDLAARFKAEMSNLRQVLLRENLYRVVQQELAVHQLTLFAEPHITPDPRVVLEAVDRAQVEFWINGRSIIKNETPGAARAFGLQTVTAEAFTAFPEDSRWSESPARLKRFADAAMGFGVTRMMLHSVPHQPFVDPRFRPGMTMGWWGTKFGWQQTWWRPGKAFFDYLTRASVLLEHGEVPARLLVLGWHPEQGYNTQHSVDFAGVESILKARVEDGSLVLPSGRRYSLLALPSQPAMPLHLAKAVRSLVYSGAAVVGTRPERSLQVSQRENADAEVAEIGRELWGDAPLADGTVRQLGRGRVMGHRSLNAALVELGVPPEFSTEPRSVSGKLRHQHRLGPEAEIFYLAAFGDEPLEFTGVFGTAAGRPELWNLMRGTRRALPDFKVEGGVTSIPIRMEAGDSLCVVFPKEGAPAPAAAGPNFTQQEVLRPIESRWNVCFKGARADGSDAVATFGSLEDWRTSEDPDVRYFSGTATYSGRLDLSRAEAARNCWLDLGTVEVIARVSLNGRDLGVVWSAPWRVELSGAKEGENRLEIEVTNLWINRLVGDEKLPRDFEAGRPQFGLQRKEPIGAPIAAWPEWFTRRQPRASGRRTLTSWLHFDGESALAPSGLLGPLVLRAEP
jgi:hypothetical protein